jgi:hypothetical protein
MCWMSLLKICSGPIETPLVTGPLGNFNRRNAYKVPLRTTADRSCRAVGMRSCRMVTNTLEEVTDVAEFLEASSSFKDPVGHA